MEQQFFYENDVRITKTAVKVLRWLIVVFPDYKSDEPARIKYLH